MNRVILSLRKLASINKMDEMGKDIRSIFILPQAGLSIRGSTCPSLPHHAPLTAFASSPSCSTTSLQDLSQTTTIFEQLFNTNQHGQPQSHHCFCKLSLACRQPHPRCRRRLLQRLQIRGYREPCLVRSPKLLRNQQVADPVLL